MNRAPTKKGGVKLTTALTSSRSVRAVPVAAIPVPVVPVAAVIAAIPVAVMTIAAVMTRRAVAAGAVVHAGCQAQACDEQQGSAQFAVADHSMLQVEGAVGRRAVRRHGSKPLGVRVFRAFDAPRLARAKARMDQGFAPRADEIVGVAGQSLLSTAAAVCPHYTRQTREQALRVASDVGDLLGNGRQLVAVAGQPVRAQIRIQFRRMRGEGRDQSVQIGGGKPREDLCHKIVNRELRTFCAMGGLFQDRETDFDRRWHGVHLSQSERQCTCNFLTGCIGYDLRNITLVSASFNYEIIKDIQRSSIQTRLGVKCNSEAEMKFEILEIPSDVERERRGEVFRFEKDFTIRLKHLSNIVVILSFNAVLSNIFDIVDHHKICFRVHALNGDAAGPIQYNIILSAPVCLILILVAALCEEKFVSARKLERTEKSKIVRSGGKCFTVILACRIWRFFYLIGVFVSIRGICCNFSSRLNSNLGSIRTFDCDAFYLTRCDYLSHSRSGGRICPVEVRLLNRDRQCEYANPPVRQNTRHNLQLSPNAAGSKLNKDQLCIRSKEIVGFGEGFERDQQFSDQRNRQVFLGIYVNRKLIGLDDYAQFRHFHRPVNTPNSRSMRQYFLPIKVAEPNNATLRLLSTVVL